VLKILLKLLGGGGGGVLIPPKNFDKADFLKDLEVARHTLQVKQKLPIPNVDEVDIINKDSNEGNVPLLEWLDDDSKNESFTLVQSKKKKKKQVKFILKHPVGEPPIRRSKRSTPSVYKSVRG
jgi:hypothetical protein